ncbi:MAG TPA: SOS response-associated peptidase [Dermatophilaceae bacterium]|nr:SOS response-associated peptidase [Dermatophilaceae bacterium]
MCGRYAATARPDQLVEEFEAEDRTAEPARSILAAPQVPPRGAPDFNLAPTKQAPVVLTRPARARDVGAAPAGGGDFSDSQPGGEPARQLRLLTWGLVPGWAKDVKVGVRMINARAESVLEKPAFARAATARRALVPARGWYEWQKSPTATDGRGRPRRQPFFTERVDGDVVAFAGLYEFWRDPAVADGEDPDAWLTTFAVLTTAAEPGLDRIHDRQPLVLDRQYWAPWLDPTLVDRDRVAGLLAPHPPGRFTAYPVSRAVSSNRANGPHLLDPAPQEDLVGVVDPATGELLGAAR